MFLPSLRADSWRPSRVAVAAFLALLVCSCNSGRKPVYPVRGQVLDSQNRPAIGALVVFHPVDGDDPATPKPVAHVDEKGGFALTTHTKGDGAPAGEYSVTITWPPPRKTPLDPEGPDQLKGRYADPKTSKVPRFKVEKQPQNEVPVIKLP